MGMSKTTLNKWVKALRSGKYTQTTGQLRHTKQTIAKEIQVAKEGGLNTEDEENLKVGFCCLGVLATVCPIKRVKVNFNNGVLPDDYLDIIGLTRDTQDTLAAMNDGGSSFEEIACLLEERYTRLSNALAEEA